jgi:hypothetical protein
VKRMPYNIDPTLASSFSIFLQRMFRLRPLCKGQRFTASCPILA